MAIIGTYDQYLNASNGIGEAVRANVVVNRAIGNSQINVDSVLNWPSKFIATVGTLDTTTGIFTPGTVTVFFGHLSGSYIIIDERAPGYSDIGNTANQIVVLKPTTPWADKLVATLNAKVKSVVAGANIAVDATDAVNPVVKLSGTVPVANGGTGGTTAADLAALVGAILFPVGAIFTTVVATNPGTSLGFGTWVAWGSGRVPVGMGSNGTTNYTVVEATGGEEKHQLTVAELPNVYGYWTIHGQENGTNWANAVGYANSLSSYGAYKPPGGTATGANSLQNPGFNFGSNTPHENRQPYITAYMWKRTA